MGYAVMGLPEYGPVSGKVLWKGKDISGMSIR
ncbi:MAG: hypothetical protein U5N26_12415 [Candidatus Marinimicrobia bacterium]|nr:hypothetical protein [Candidatus Neomarinimicrobiota bacterium]